MCFYVYRLFQIYIFFSVHRIWQTFPTVFLQFYLFILYSWTVRTQKVGKCRFTHIIWKWLRFVCRRSDEMFFCCTTKNKPSLLSFLMKINSLHHDLICIKTKLKLHYYIHFIDDVLQCDQVSWTIFKIFILYILFAFNFLLSFGLFTIFR